MVPSESSQPGLDVDRLAAYLAGHLPGGLAGQLTAERIVGGRSNLTYRVTDGASVWAVRRPPLGHVLPTAHDMGREHRVLAALASTAVPVPQVLLHCAEESVLGAPFYVMEYVDGVVLREPAQTADLSPAQAAACGMALVEVLAALHAVVPAEVGLGGLGRPGYLARQVARWHQQWERSRTRELPELEEVTALLAAAVPESGPPGVVHGDYRLDNVMFDAGRRRIVAVLDWEMATVGDPLADVGLLWVYTELAHAGLGPATPFRPDAGFPAPAALVAAYAGRRPGVRLDKLGWYVALGYYKLAVVSEGIHRRYLAGQTVGAGFEELGARVPALVHRARQALATGPP
ncbi:MAG TPA: phosphotransferase family protein [Mycobacteriales bacterium]|nr:phosphotransferase family protein [Mycobacteriales bacterium]